MGSSQLGVVMETNNAWVERGLYDNLRDRQRWLTIVQLNDFRIGNRQAFPNAFPGTIDELKVYNRALSSSEVAAIYAAGSNGNCKPVVALSLIILIGSGTCLPVS